MKNYLLLIEDTETGEIRCEGCSSANEAFKAAIDLMAWGSVCAWQIQKMGELVNAPDGQLEYLMEPIAQSPNWKVEE